MKRSANDSNSEHDITHWEKISEQVQQNVVGIERVNNLLDIGMDISQMCVWEYDLKTLEFQITRQVVDIIEMDHLVMPRQHEMIGYFDLADRYLLLRTLKKSLEQRISFDLELELNCISNKKKWVRIVGVPVSESHGARFFQGILKDISTDKRRQLELLAAKNMAEQSARKRIGILSIISHEIRTPLNAIIGICNLLNQMVIENPDVSKLIQHLRFSSNHLLHLVDDIMDLEKIRNRKMTLNETEINLVVLVEQIKMQFFQAAHAKKLDLKSRFSDSIPMVLADEFRLSRILNNLVSNAIKFTEGGEVSISLETIERNEGSVKILFRVIDTGIGIPDYFHNLVFDRFLQVQQTSRRKQQGMGLGLSITKDLLKLFKSEMLLLSKPGQGSTFEFEIDFKLPKISGSKKIDRLKKNRLSRLPSFSLLIVDDNLVNLLVAKSQVGTFGIAADLIDSGPAALELLKTKHYDIILIDLHMPEMDGYALATEVKQIYPHIKRIIFTTDPLEEVRKRFNEIGIFHILSKPFKPEDMHAVLLATLNDKVG